MQIAGPTIPMITEDQLEQLEQLDIQWRGMCRPFRAWKPVGGGTQGDALSCRMLPRWGVCNSQGFLVSCNQIKWRLNP